MGVENVIKRENDNSQKNEIGSSRDIKKMKIDLKKEKRPL